MSANKADYPERPVGGRRPKRPGENRKKSSSEHISGRRKPFFVKAVAESAVKQQRESYDKLDLASCIIGHTTPMMSRFLAQHRHNRVPLHQWGKKGRTIEV